MPSGSKICVAHESEKRLARHGFDAALTRYPPVAREAELGSRLEQDADLRKALQAVDRPFAGLRHRRLVPAVVEAGGLMSH